MSIKQLQDTTIHHDNLNIRCNNLTIDGNLNQQTGTIWKELIAEPTGAGITSFKDYETGNVFTFEEEDIVFHIVGIAKNISPFAGNIEIGTSLTDGGAIVQSEISNAVASWSAGGKGLYMVCDLTGGVTSARIRLIVHIWRRRTPI